MIASQLPSCVRLGVWLAAGVALALGLGACASDEAGRRALVETGALRIQMDEVKQHEENTARDLARVQSQLRALDDDQKRRATRSLRDGIDRIMVDLLSLYRDVLLLHLGVGDDLVNESIRPQLEQAVTASTPATTLAVMDAVSVARRRIESNVAPALALEAMLVAVSRHAVR